MVERVLLNSKTWGTEVQIPPGIGSLSISRMLIFPIYHNPDYIREINVGENDLDATPEGCIPDCPPERLGKNDRGE